MELKDVLEGDHRCPERIDYLSFQANELVFVARGREAARAGGAARRRPGCACASAELEPIHSHLVWLGTSALELGAISMFWYASASGTRSSTSSRWSPASSMHTRYFQVGGLAEDIPAGLLRPGREVLRRGCRSAVDDYEALLDQERDLARADEGDRLLSAEDAIALGAARAGAARLRRRLGPPQGASRTSPTTRSTSSVPVYLEGRRLRPLHASTWTRCVSRTASSPSASTGSRRWKRRAVDRGRPQGRPAAAGGAPHLDGVLDPPLQDRHRGLPRPRGRGLRPRSSRPRGELGCYVVSDGGPRPWRVKFRAPSFAALAGDGHLYARRCSSPTSSRSSGSLDTGHGRGRPVNADVRGTTRCSELRRSGTRTPRSAVLPALRLARGAERRVAHARALREVGRRARPHARRTASPSRRFYDMFHLGPCRPAPRRGLHEPLVRARRARSRCVEAFEWSSSGSAPARRPRTARSRCGRSSALGGCGYATVVAVDNRYRELYVKPEDVPAS